MNVYPFIEAEQAGQHNVKRACELLEVSRSAYNQQQSGVLSRRRSVDAELTAEIVQVHAMFKGTYGAPRIHADLTDAGLRHGRKTRRPTDARCWAGRQEAAPVAEHHHRGPERQQTPRPGQA